MLAKLQSISSSQTAKVTIFALSMGLLGGLISVTPSGIYLGENFGLSWLFNLRGPIKAPGEVILIAINRDSPAQMGLPDDPEKWPRSPHVRLIRKLKASGASIIVFNLIFEETRAAKEDRIMAKAMREANNVVLSDYLKRNIVLIPDGEGNPTGATYADTLVPPAQILAAAAVASAPFPLPKGTINVKQFWTFKHSFGGIATLPVAVLQLYAIHHYFDPLLSLIEEATPNLTKHLPKRKNDFFKNQYIHQYLNTLKSIFEAEPELLENLNDELDQARYPTRTKRVIRAVLNSFGAQRSHYLNYYGPAKSITTIPYHNILDEASQDSTQVSGKIVFIGFSEDLQPERSQGFYDVFQHGGIGSAEIAATSLANLLDDDTIRPLGSFIQFTLIFLWGSMIGAASYFLRIRYATIAIIAVSVLYCALAFTAFERQNLWLPLFIPICLQVPIAFLCALFYRYGKSNQERENIRKAFSYYLPPDVVESLASQKNNQGIIENSRLMHGVCLATDAGKYTSLAESMDPMALGNLMNEYYAAIFQPVRQHGGNISDVIGDAMLAIWATPQIDDKPRVEACRAALDVQRAVYSFNESREFELPTRIGLHYGQMRIGNVGSSEHYEYRAVGDIVNTATRIEGLNKKLGTRVLASLETVSPLAEFYTRELGTFLLEGKTRAIVVHEIMGRTENVSPHQKKLAEDFSDALHSFVSGNYETALTLFTQILKLFPYDGPARFYRQKCLDCRQKTAPNLENGVISMPK